MNIIHKYKSLSAFKESFDYYNSLRYKYIAKAIELLESLGYEPNPLYLSESSYSEFRLNYDLESSIVKEKEVKFEIVYKRLISPRTILYLVLEIDNNIVVHCHQGRKYCTIEYDIDLEKIDEVVKKFFED